MEHQGKQYVRAGSALGKRLAAAGEGAEVPVIYEPYDPRMCRVVGPEDFLSQTSADLLGDQR